MIKIICLAVIAFFQVQAIEQKCDGVIVNGIMHTKEVLKTNVDSPYQFSIDYNTNTLFFSYSTHTEDQRFKMAYLNLKTKQFDIVTTVKDGFASAIDSINNKIFLGAKGGIYEFNLKTKQTNLIAASNQSIWQMFYKDGIYYTTYPTEEGHSFKDGTLERLPELMGTRTMLIALDKNKNIYFTNSSGLFKYNKSNKEVLHLGEYVINGLNSDINGKLFFSSPNGIFSINETQNTVQRLVTLENIYSAAIEKDGSILCGIDDSIIRLKISDKCYV